MSTDTQAPLLTAADFVAHARKALRCLYVAADAEVAASVEKACEDAFTFLLRRPVSAPQVPPHRADLSSLVRSILTQGHAQQMDYDAGKCPLGYEEFCAHFEASIAPRVEQLLALSASPSVEDEKLLAVGFAQQPDPPFCSASLSDAGASTGEKPNG